MPPIIVYPNYTIVGHTDKSYEIVTSDGSIYNYDAKGNVVGISYKNPSEASAAITVNVDSVTGVISASDTLGNTLSTRVTADASGTLRLSDPITGLAVGTMDQNAGGGLVLTDTKGNAATIPPASSGQVPNVVRPNADGSIDTTQFTAEGSTTIRTDASGNIVWKAVTTAGNEPGTYHSDITDSNGVLRGTEDIASTSDGAGSTQVITDNNGNVRTIIADADGNILSDNTVHQDNGALTLAQSLNTIGDALNLINAIKTGQPLPIAVTGLRLASTINPGNTDLAGAANVGSGILSLLGLNNAIKRGDVAGAINAGAQTVSFAANAYVNFYTSNALTVANASSDGIGTLAGELDGVDGVAGAAQGLGDAIPYLNLVNAIAHGDTVGTAVAAISLIPGMQWVGIVYGIYSLVTSLFGGDDSIPDPWGAGHYVQSGTGLVVSADGQTGGSEAVANLMTNVLTVMNNIITQEQQQSPGNALGLIANRMPTVSYGTDGFHFVDIDPLTGVEKYPTLRYDTSGNPYNAPAGSPESFVSLGTALIESAIARGAIAPTWEVQTATLQTQLGDPQAGLTEEERAGRANDLASKPTGTTQTWRPVVLDLTGAGIHTVAKNLSGVAFNVDDSGFLKSSDWITSGEAFLVLDRNENGVINTSKDLFSNGTVGLDRRGLASLDWVDANEDGVIDATDPVFKELKIWQDANSNGVVDTGEMHSLADAGITTLNYKLGSFVQGGVTKQMASPDLNADTAGSQVVVIPQGILLKTTDGKISLIVTRVDDLGAIQANEDGLHGIENVELIVSGADLLANDTYGSGQPGSNLTLTGVANVTHGTAYVDSNHFVHFMPETNYYGADAGFDYIATGPAGQTGSAHAVVTLDHTNAAPTLGEATHDQRAIYGYAAPVAYSRGYPVGYALYEPYTISSGRGFVEPHLTPIEYDDPGTGNVAATDIDDATNSLTYQILNQPQFGAATIDNSGNFIYTEWSAPNVSSGPKAHLIGDTGTQDAFVVQVTDPHGATSTETVYVTHYGTYTPPKPPGGGSGGCLPVVIDMAGNGFSFTPVDQSSIFADVNGDGWKHQTSWIKPGEGVLVYDPTGSGTVTDPSQLSFTKYLKGAQTDLEGLSAFDTNHDGVFNASDTAWAKFALWQDANDNGVVDAGEMKSLTDIGIASINLTSNKQFSVVDGNTIEGIASVTMTDGTTRNAADVVLANASKIQVQNPDGSTSVVTPPPFSASGQEIDGTSGNDLLLGGTGNTRIQSGAGNDVIFSGDGNDLIQTGDGNSVIYAGNGNDVILVGQGNNVINTTGGNDLITAGNGNNAILTAGGNNIILVGNGNNLISTGNGNSVVRAGDGENTIVVGSGNNAIFAGNGNNRLQAGAGYNRMQVGNGDDTLIAGAGGAEMIGGTGRNTFVISSDKDVIEAQSTAKNNTVIASFNYTMADAIDDVTLSGTQNLTAAGNSRDNILTGNAGNSTLIGAGGNDTLIAGAGATTMIAGGNPSLSGGYVSLGGGAQVTFVVKNAGDIVIADAGSNNTILTSVSYTAAANVQTLTGRGIGNLTLTGNELNNVITANNSNDTLIAGSGIATLNGGTGNDTFVINNAADVVNAKVGGINTILTSVNYVAPTNVQNITGTGTGNLSLTGNNLANVITANDANDTLVAGAGVATMNGGMGNDTFVVNNVADVVNAKVDGVNTVLTSVNYVAPINVQNITGTGIGDLVLTGNNLANVITANNSNDTLIAGAGVATMNGGTGNDTFVVNNIADVVNAKVGGINTIQTSVSYTASANVQNLTGTGSGDLTLIGNNLANNITANNGNDTLIAGSGVATMNGGTGNDTFVVNNGADVVNAKVGGINTIQTSASYTASANVQNLTGTGTGDLTLTGNNLANVITANNANDTLIAGSGVATLNGGTGNDTFVINNTADVINAKLGGINTVLTSVSYVAPANVQNITGTGAANLTLTGNNLANIITANNGNDTLVAGSGVATMNGGTGNDTFVVNNVADVVNAKVGGVNSVITSVNYVTPANVQNLTGTGSADLVLTGNNLNNVITANNANDTLIAGMGIATLNGGVGNDTFVVNNIADVVNAKSTGVNTIQTSVSYTASTNVKNLTGIGTGNLTLTGNNLANVITATNGNDTLIAGSGIATMNGGTGNDTFVINNVADVVNAKIGGVNTVLTSVNYVAPANVQNITGTGAANLTLTGNNLANVITANNGNDTLIAGSGVATMNGGTGNDTFVVNNVADVVNAKVGGINTIQTSVSYTASANVQNLVGTGTGNLTLTGNNLANVITANNANDILIAGSGVATLNGGNGNDTFVVNNVADVVNAKLGGLNTILTSVSYVAPANVQNITGTGSANLTLTGNSLNNVITANNGNDTLVGANGNDTFVLGVGNETVVSGTGNDTYVFQQVDGLTNIRDLGGNNSVQLGVGLSLQNSVIRLTTADGKPYTVYAGKDDGHGDWYHDDWGSDENERPLTTTTLTAHMRVLDAHGVEQVSQGIDFAVTVDRWGNLTSPIQSFKFSDGSINTFNDMLIKSDVIDATRTIGAVTTGRNDDIVYAGSRNTPIYLSSGNDTVYASATGSTIYGGGGNDYLVGSFGNDTLVGGWGLAVLQGGYGSDVITDLNGTGALIGGQGNDNMTGGTGNNFFYSGYGNDSITTGASHNVVAFNVGQGQDTIAATTGASNTLSLGGGLSIKDMTFAKSGNDLVMADASGDKLTFKDWYVTSANHDFVTLQVVEQANWDYNPYSNDAQRNQKIETYDFSKLVTDYDAARAKTPSLSKWGLMNGMLDSYLGGSNTAALGGDLAYQFGVGGGIDQIGLANAFSNLKNPQFGKTAQTLTVPTGHDSH